MKLKYRDGTEDEDNLFDRPDDEQRAFVARCMNLSPDPDYWPEDVIENLLCVRRLDGKPAFHRRLQQMLSPSRVGQPSR